MGKLRGTGLALIALLLVGAFADGSTAAASKVLTLSAEGFEGEALTAKTPFYDNEDGVVSYSFALKGVKFKCEVDNTLLGLEGTVLSNEGATDALHIEHWSEEASECRSRGIVAELYAGGLPATVRAGANGEAELSSQVEMLVYISVGEEELECVFETPALKGTNTATRAEKPFVLDFPAARNKFALEASHSSAGCPATLRAGFKATGLDADVGEGAASLFERVQS